MPLDDIMSMWYTHSEAGPGDTGMEPWSGEWTRPDDETAVHGGNTARADQDQTQEHPTRWDDEDLHAPLPRLGMYRDVILKSPAYRWLLTDIKRQFSLMPSTTDTSQSIREKILEALPSPRHFSRRDPPRPLKLTIVMPWDPLKFDRDQGYSEKTQDVLASVITLTGSRRNAQALTTEQYLCQTWPSSGHDVLEFILQVLRRPLGTRSSRSLSDGTVIRSWLNNVSGGLARQKFAVEAVGTAYSLAEVGEQLAWIGAALRSSQYPDGVASVRPKLKRLQVIEDKSRVQGKGYLAEVRCQFAFKVRPPTPPDRQTEVRTGECWHNLFRNPVLVKGFPIARRPGEMVSGTGLEIPLYMMAGLAGAKVVGSFCGRTVLKGFSTILIPTHRYDNVVVWHLIHNQHGDRVSYLECLADYYKVGLISCEQLQASRHVLGWCTKTKFLAGTEAGKYDVAGSRLPRPRTMGVLRQVSISSGQVISGGAPFIMGYKDSPFHVARNGYIRKLKWISRKFVVLWDEDTKRGWLINGTSALLHLVRASLEQDSKDKFSSEFLFRVNHLKEAPPDTAYTSDSAIKVLLNRANLGLKLYREDDGCVVFKDRVEHVFRLLEQAMDHQVNVSDSYGGKPAINSMSRAYLEGWDFRDLAIDSDPVYSRVSSLSSLGMGWVDLTRSIHAVTLLGRGFGDIMTPVEQSCAHWGTLPTDRYYLAVSLSDVRDIMEAVGDAISNPPRLTDRLEWLNTDAITAASCCTCTGQEGDEHSDVVQVILPLGLANIPLPKGSHQPQDGAVIFGHNKNILWFWKETGDPVHGSVESSKRLGLGLISPPDSDSGYGPSNGGERDSIRTTNPSVSGPSNAPSVRQMPPSGIRRREPRLGNALKLQAYKVGLVCALPLELLAVRALFDVTHADGDEITTPSADSNHYILGEMGGHKVVAACLPDGEYGTNSAADVAANMRRTFPSIKFALLVGIGGGVPTAANDMRLGDVVVSRPTGTDPGVIQYDMGKARENGLFTPSGFLHPPPRLIMTALGKLRSDPYSSQTPLQEFLREVAACRREYRYPGRGHDWLFRSEYHHVPHQETCKHCDKGKLHGRELRLGQSYESFHPQIHYGTIASGNSVMRDAELRDYWAEERKVLCFEMEAAGIVNTMPCLVIRGICDYADSHKNKVFQNYAAAAAASYAKLLLSNVKDLGDLEGSLQEAKVDGTLNDNVGKTSKLKGLRRAFKTNLAFFTR
ncbi:hypothetical protein BJY01DRAFT_233960 [Aspergillus pseudoustus]|uniref:Nucleoside phosphorylase domain-containing protein n=1 Tax=Aspergillus pseudoustus TaxID=1810923 RepID=A0ABR4K7W0_9EURO